MPHFFVLKVLCLTAPYVSFYRSKMVQVVWKGFFLPFSYPISIKKIFHFFSTLMISSISSKYFFFLFFLWTISTFHFPQFSNTVCYCYFYLQKLSLTPSFLLFQVTWTCGLLTPSVIHFSPLIAPLTPFGLLILPNQFLQNHQWPSGC